MGLRVSNSECAGAYVPADCHDWNDVKAVLISFEGAAVARTRRSTDRNRTYDPSCLCKRNARGMVLLKRYFLLSVALK